MKGKPENVFPELSPAQAEGDHVSADAVTPEPRAGVAGGSPAGGAVPSHTPPLPTRPAGPGLTQTPTHRP